MVAQAHNSNACEARKEHLWVWGQPTLESEFLGSQGYTTQRNPVSKTNIIYIYEVHYLKHMAYSKKVIKITFYQKQIGIEYTE